jgi:putative chitinase
MAVTLCAKEDTIGKTRPIESSLLLDTEKFNLKAGNKFSGFFLYPNIQGHCGIKTLDKKQIWYFFLPHVFLSWENLITREQLFGIMTAAKPENIERFLAPINETLNEFDINTPVRIAAFLAQIGHESASLRYSEEIASGEDYEGRTDLGNINPGDGKRFKGRGLIQLTGRSNYLAAGEFFGVPFIDKPSLVALPQHAARVSGWFWRRRLLNDLADANNVDSFIAITKRINGGVNGLTDRLRRWKIAKQILVV